MTTITAPAPFRLDPEVFTRAAALIRKGGLTKGSFRMGPDERSRVVIRTPEEVTNCRHCAMGAVLDVVDPEILNVGNHSSEDPRVLPYLALLGRVVSPEQAAQRIDEELDLAPEDRTADWFFWMIGTYNDDFHRSVDEVAGKLEEAAVLAGRVNALRDAAALIRKHGLTKHEYRSDEEEILGCAHCTMGAVIDVVVPLSGPFDPQVKPLLSEVATTINPLWLTETDEPEATRSEAYFSVIEKWNDAEERTAPEVADALDATANRLAGVVPTETQEV